MRQDKTIEHEDNKLHKHTTCLLSCDMYNNVLSKMNHAGD